MSYQQKHPSEEGRTDVDSQLKEENWFKLISARASEAVTNIQQASISDSMDTSADVDMENGDSLDDVKWMETVLAVLISGRIFFFFLLIRNFDTNLSLFFNPIYSSSISSSHLSNLGGLHI